MSTPGQANRANIPQDVIEKASQILITQPHTNSFAPLDEIISDKYLGVILDNQLSFNHHVDSIATKATNILNLCRRNLHMCSPQVKETAYKSLVRPLLEYASTAWSPHTSRNIDKLEAVQRRAARFTLGYYIYGPNANLTQQINNNLKWQSLQHRRALYDLSLFYKIRSNLVNINFPPTVQVSPRHPDRYLHIQALHSEAYRYHFYNRSIRYWNILPINITQVTTLEAFKTQCQSWITPLAWERRNGIWTLA